MSLTDRAAYKWLMQTISPVPLQPERIRRRWTAAKNCGPVLTGRRDGNRQTLKQRQHDKANDDSKHGNDERASPIRRSFAVERMASSRRTEQRVVIIHSSRQLRVRGANGMRPPENALLRPAEITALIMVASPRKSFSECTFPT
jgi:hypothetical protein